MQFNGVNNEECQRFLVVSGFCIYTYIGIPCALHRRHSCVCFERVLEAL